MTPTQQNAIREADAYLRCAGLPTYSEVTAQPAAVSDADVDRAAQIIANDRGYGWPHIPESWKQEFRETALAILALRPQAESEARRAAQEQLYTERERHAAEVKRLQAEIGRLQSLRPQSAPMTDERLADVLTTAYGSPEWTMDDVRAARAVEAAALGITAQAKEVRRG